MAWAYDIRNKYRQHILEKWFMCHTVTEYSVNFNVQYKFPDWKLGPVTHFD